MKDVALDTPIWLHVSKIQSLDAKCKLCIEPLDDFGVVAESGFTVHSHNRCIIKNH